MSNGQYPNDFEEFKAKFGEILQIYCPCYYYFFDPYRGQIFFLHMLGQMKRPWSFAWASMLELIHPDCTLNSPLALTKIPMSRPSEFCKRNLAFAP